VDAFIRKELERRELSPAPPAEKLALLRRASFDLLGLPPLPGEAEAFLSDDSPEAYEKLVERLLASPRYGERWGRHWLDLVRFAESDGYERDGAKPNAWRYRDYVVRSFNEDQPYDRFITEQLAGDELDQPTTDSLIATGFYRLGSWDDEPDDKEEARYDELDDVVRTTGSAFLGLTVNCARCHDHKFDAIPQRDYYRLLAFFSGLKHSNEVPLVPAAEVEAHRAALAAADAKVKELEGEIAGLVEPARTRIFQEKLARLPAKLREAQALPADRRSGEEKADAEKAQKQAAPTAEELEQALDAEPKEKRSGLKRRIEEINRGRPRPYPMALGVVEDGPSAPPTHLLVRGNAHQRGEEVAPGYLSLLTTANPAIASRAGARTSFRRRALAEWIADPRNPLTARVMVNRVWQFHFGRGIVRSPSDFGAMGDPPTHPALLDWLARELIEGGWRLKPLHRLIMTSSTYRTSSRCEGRGAEVDPQNDLFWRADLRRIEAEAIRDAVLSTSGRLNLKMGGPSVFPPIPAQVLHGQSRPGDGWGKSEPSESSRRSVYVFVKRSLPLPILEVFDSADTGQTCSRRNVTTIAPQALSMLNSEFLAGESRSFAERVLREAGSDPRAQVERAYRLALARAPSPSEAGTAAALLARQRELASGPGGPEEAERVALSSLCLVILNLNEFLYLD
jgi:hypothetical protein